MQYGTEEITRTIDKEGSTLTKVKNFVAGKESSPTRRKYEIKKRVRSQREEHEAYLDFSDQLSKNKGMLDPAFLIKRSRLGDDNGYYFVVCCYTVLEY